MSDIITHCLHVSIKEYASKLTSQLHIKKKIAHRKNVLISEKPQINNEPQASCSKFLFSETVPDPDNAKQTSSKRKSKDIDEKYFLHNLQRRVQS